MNKRKILLIVFAALSVITTFLPLYIVKGVGVALDIPKEFSLPIPLVPTVYGVLMIISAAAIIGFVFLKIKLGYVIASVVNAVISFIGLIDMSNRANTDPALLFDQVGNAMSSYNVSDVVTGPAFFLVIIVSVVILGTMIFNVLEKEEE
jgi:hypothetical protein